MFPSINRSNKSNESDRTDFETIPKNTKITNNPNWSNVDHLRHKARRHFMDHTSIMPAFETEEFKKIYRVNKDWYEAESPNKVISEKFKELRYRPISELSHPTKQQFIIEYKPPEDLQKKITLKSI